MSTLLNRKCVKIIYGIVVLFLMTKCINSSNPKKHSNMPMKYPPPPTKKSVPLTTTKKSKGGNESDELLTIIEDQSKMALPEVYPLNHDPCILGSASLYLQWWINEDGSLAVPEDIGMNSSSTVNYVVIINQQETSLRKR